MAHWSTRPLYQDINRVPDPPDTVSSPLRVSLLALFFMVVTLHYAAALRWYLLRLTWQPLFLDASFDM